MGMQSMEQCSGLVVIVYQWIWKEWRYMYVSVHRIPCLLRAFLVHATQNVGVTWLAAGSLLLFGKLYSSAGSTLASVLPSSLHHVHICSYHYVKFLFLVTKFFLLVLFSCDWLCHQGYCRGAGVRRSSIVRPWTQVSQKTPHGSRPKKLWEATYPPYLQTYFLFLFFKYLLILFFVSLTWDRMGAKIS